MADMGIDEELMVELEKKVSILMKAIEERDYEMVFLKNHIENRNVAKSSQTPTVKNNDKGKIILQKSQRQDSTSIVLLSIQQLQDMITNSIKAQCGGPSQNSLLYSKPYTKRIDNLRMSTGY